MINNKRVIGVCITKIHSISYADYTNRLHYIAQKQGYKLIIFNSFVDFFNKDSFDDGARAVFDMINYDVLDALVVHLESFHTKQVGLDIIEKAKKKGVPVIVVGGRAEGCYIVTPDYEEPYKQLISHVIKEHSAVDTYYIAGNKGDDISERRTACYRAALEENGIPFDESRVGYGEYWSGPVRDIIDGLLADGKKPPEAIFCANDYMAMAACDRLAEFGYSVPDDVIVTGFDGVPAAELYSPSISTCEENLEGLARLTVQAITMAVEGEPVCEIKNHFSVCLSESCGCTRMDDTRFKKYASALNTTIDDIHFHEDSMYTWINRMFDIRDMSDLQNILAGVALAGSYVCINSDFLATVGDSDERQRSVAKDLIVIPSRFNYTEAGKLSKLRRSDMVPNVEEWLEDDTAYILSAVHVGSRVCGVYAYKAYDIANIEHKLKRVQSTVVLAFSSAINSFRQAEMRQSIERAALTNAVTALPNLKGAIRWFERFSVPENMSKTLTVSVYGLPKYTYIQENYGISAADEAVSFVAQALKMANSEDCFIAHVAEDAFAVINYYDEPDSISDVINKATSVFFSVIEGYNTRSSKDYYVEVNCGCTYVAPNWSGSLESFIKFANSEMYMNRLKSGSGKVMKSESVPKDLYKAFDLLMKKNLFNYHFQPIVSAKNGEIYGYEALMRTDASIGMNPLQVLEAAREYSRLDDVERATMFNVMERYAADRESFGDSRVFINTIPGHLISDEDIDLLMEQHGEYMDSFVFELTEQGTVSDEELQKLSRLNSGDSESHIAIDDYGTGHSNIVNLMRYTPRVIKIDRYLITDIHKNQNKQLFVRSIIEFAKLNGIMVLAEGVETSNELHTVIDLGVDLIQGYYTARPAPEPIRAIREEIRREIIEANPLFGQEI